ncbi:hypothetical protein [Streptomyces brevispora]
MPLADRGTSIILTESGDPTGTTVRTTPAALAALFRVIKEAAPRA